MRQSACFVINSITVNNFAFLFNCTSWWCHIILYDGPTEFRPDFKLFNLVCWGRSFFACCSAHRVQLVILFYFRFSVVLFYSPVISRYPNKLFLPSPRFLFIIEFLSFTCAHDDLIDEFEGCHSNFTTTLKVMFCENGSRKT